MVLALALSAVFQGCVLTKIITVPMRIGGAIISIIPVVGNPVDASIDKAADVVDDVPI
jgi:hypothetical protein